MLRPQLSERVSSLTSRSLSVKSDLINSMDYMHICFLVLSLFFLLEGEWVSIRTGLLQIIQYSRKAFSFKSTTVIRIHNLYNLVDM